MPQLVMGAMGTASDHIGGYFACPGSAGRAACDRRGCVRPWHTAAAAARARPGDGPVRQQDAGSRSAEPGNACLGGGPAPTWPARLGQRRGTRNSWRQRAPGRYARPMEISPNWGNLPRFRVQVPPRTRKTVKSPLNQASPEHIIRTAGVSACCPPSRSLFRGGHR
jgi:hypothetical protein